MHPGGLRLTDRAARLAALKAGMLVADLGCGAGATASHLTSRFGLRVIGLEISERLLAAGLHRDPGLCLIRSDCKALPFGDGSLDAVVIECALSVLGSMDVVLAECARALKSSGKLIISDLVSKCEPASGQFLTEAGLAQRLLKAGFRIVINEDHTPALRTYAAELRTPRGEQEGDPERALRAGGPLRSGQSGPDFAVGARCLGRHSRLSDLGYVLLIATLSDGEG